MQFRLLLALFGRRTGYIAGVWIVILAHALSDGYTVFGAWVVATVVSAWLDG
jgi:hypothetical protein